MKKLFLYGLILFSVLFIYGCGHGSLSRSKAQEIINEHYHYPFAVFSYLIEGELDEEAINSLRGWESEGEIFHNINFSNLSQFSSLGYLKMEKTGIVKKSRSTGKYYMTLYGSQYVYENYDVDKYAISLTDKGKTLFQKDTKPKRQNLWKILLSKKGILEITGIAPSGDNLTAEVEYTIGYFDYAKIPDDLASILKPSSDIKKSKALMRKYDDGWRFEKDI